LRTVYTAGFEFLLYSVQIVKIGTYIVMPFHAIYPRVYELQNRIRRSSKRSKRHQGS
jgi:hypothetical protein